MESLRLVQFEFEWCARGLPYENFLWPTPKGKNLFIGQGHIDSKDRFAELFD
jgi:hypothetical protein